MFLVYDHRQFTVKRKGFAPEDIAEWYGTSFRTLDYEGYYVFPVAAYIHSDIVLNLTDSLQRQGWDTSVTGFILVHKDSVFITEKDKSKTKEQIAKEYAEGLIETWNQYLSGDVWGFKVFKKVKYYNISEDKVNKIIDNSCKNQECIWLEDFREKSEETVKLKEEDSCWGFYGSDIKTNGILDYIGYKLVENEK
ncbi:MAG: hypothetical protein ACK53T_07915 [Planctomycetota bacterium]|jgi:hypothetical protein